MICFLVFLEQKATILRSSADCDDFLDFLRIFYQTTPHRAPVPIWDKLPTTVPSRPMLASKAMPFVYKYKCYYSTE